MCLIIDANVTGDFFAPQYKQDFEPISEWLIGKHATGVLVGGGKLTEELYRNDRMKTFLFLVESALFKGQQSPQ